MVNFIVINESPFELNNIDVTYVDEQSMNNQHADASGVTVLSDSDIPNGTQVSSVSVEGVTIEDEPTPVTIPSSDFTVIVSLMYYTDPKSGDRRVSGIEVQQDIEG